MHKFAFQFSSELTLQNSTKSTANATKNKTILIAHLTGKFQYFNLSKILVLDKRFERVLEP